MLAEERHRQLAHSARLAAERAPLLQMLAPQMLRDDGTNMERVYKVRPSFGRLMPCKVTFLTCLSCSHRADTF